MFVIIILLLFCALFPPTLIFAVKPKASMRIKSARLWLPLLVLFIILCMRIFIIEFKGQANIGWEISLFFVFIALLKFTAYIGWFEFLWRLIYKQFSWPLKYNLKYGWVSNTVLIVSLLMTILMVHIWLGGTLFFWKD